MSKAWLGENLLNFDFLVRFNSNIFICASTNVQTKGMGGVGGSCTKNQCDISFKRGSHENCAWTAAVLAQRERINWKLHSCDVLHCVAMHSPSVALNLQCAEEQCLRHILKYLGFFSLSSTEQQHLVFYHQRAFAKSVACLVSSAKEEK